MSTIEELVLDPETGSIAYVVLSFEDTGESNHTVFFALPWKTVRVNPVQHTFVADVDKRILAKSRDVSRESLERNSSAGTLDRRGAQAQRH